MIVGVSRNTISSIETWQFNPTAKPAPVLCIALDKNLRSCSVSIITVHDISCDFRNRLL